MFWNLISCIFTTWNSDILLSLKLVLLILIILLFFSKKFVLYEKSLDTLNSLIGTLYSSEIFRYSLPNGTKKKIFWFFFFFWNNFEMYDISVLEWEFRGWTSKNMTDRHTGTAPTPDHHDKVSFRIRYKNAFGKSPVWSYEKKVS